MRTALWLLLAAPALGWSGAWASAADSAPAEDQSAVVHGDTAFALDLYARLASHPGNLFFSPYSISTALALAYGGSSRNTAVEMAKTLHLDLPPARLHAAMGGISRTLNEGGSKGGYSLSVANALWGPKGAAFLPRFSDLALREYGAGLRQLDFQNDGEGSRRTINAWVEDKTSGRIKDLLAPGAIRGSTRLVLTNAVYFKGKWAAEFKKESTEDRPFHAAPGKTLQAPLMTQLRGFGYMETSAFQALEMPYLGEDVSLVALLPRRRYGLAELEKALTADVLQDWLGRLQTREVEVHIPRFKLAGEFSLARELQALGMRDAFDARKADFFLMNGRRPPDPQALLISDVVHKAFVDVNEEGTEAAAAAAAELDAIDGSVPHRPTIFRADHPFLFLIRERRSGSILFLGRVVNPAE